MTMIRVMGPVDIRPDALWPGHGLDAEERWFSPEWFDPDTEVHRPPPAHLELFIEGPDAAQLSVGYDGDTSHPLAQATRKRRARTLRWPIPRLVLSETVFEAVTELIPLAQQIVEGFSIQRGGPRGWQEHYTPAALEARDGITRALPGLLGELPVLDVRTIDEIDPAVRDALITDQTRDEDLDGVVAQLAARITPARPQDRVLLDEGREAVVRLREAARMRVRDRLAIVAGLASGDRRERDELLRRAAAWDEGDSYRSLGDLVGLSHTAVRKIVDRVSVARDEAIDHLDATVRALSLAWDPPHLPYPPRDNDEDDEEPSEWGQLAEDQYRAAYLKRRSCAVCGKPSRRLVRRWSVRVVLMPADPDDPYRTETGYVEDLDAAPAFDGEPQWGVCGTVCARKVIEADRADPVSPQYRTRDGRHRYAVESFRYVPHESELPAALADLRAELQLFDYSRESFERFVVDGETDSAANHLRSLRRDIARATAILARIGTYTPPPRHWSAGDPEPTDRYLQVRLGDSIYSNYSDLQPGPAHWGDTEDRYYTWDQLTARGELVEIPSERVELPVRAEE